MAHCMVATPKTNGSFEVMKEIIQKLLLRFGYRLNKTSTINCFEPLLYQCLNLSREFFFLQIGANDGKLADPIYNFVTENHDKLSGLAIEPMKDVFKQLCDTYKEYPNIKLANIAIHNSAKEMNLYRVDSQKASGLPAWTKGIASFNADHHKLSNTPSDAIITEKVNCVTTEELLNQFGIRHLDLLQIDTEGYDAEIILNFDFSKVKPAIIHFEHGFQSGMIKIDKLKKVYSTLRLQGYDVIFEKDDVTAYLIDSIVFTG